MIITLATDHDGEWEALYVDGMLVVQGHDISLRVVIDTILSHVSTAVALDESIDFEEVDAYFDVETGTAPECIVDLVLR